MSATAPSPIPSPAAVKVLGIFQGLQPNEHDLTWRQLAVLAFARNVPDSSVREMAAALKLAKPVVTRALDALELRKMMTRKQHNLDRRLVKANITKTGMAFIEKVVGHG